LLIKNDSIQVTLKVFTTSRIGYLQIGHLSRLIRKEQDKQQHTWPHL